MENFEFTPSELQELNKLRADGYKTIAYTHDKDGKTFPTCMYCYTPKVTISSYAVDDKNKIVFIFSLCLNCQIKISHLSAASKASVQQLFDSRIDSILANARKEKE